MPCKGGSRSAAGGALVPFRFFSIYIFLDCILNPRCAIFFLLLTQARPVAVPFPESARTDSLGCNSGIAAVTGGRGTSIMVWGDAPHHDG